MNKNVRPVAIGERAFSKSKSKVKIFSENLTVRKNLKKTGQVVFEK
jgi:hypothetical protein